MTGDGYLMKRSMSRARVVVVAMVAVRLRSRDNTGRVLAECACYRECRRLILRRSAAILKEVGTISPLSDFVILVGNFLARS